MTRLKLTSFFSGIGAFEAALRNLGIGYEVVRFSEIDPYCIKNYCAIHGVDPSLNLGDISKADLTTIPTFDLLTYGFPCQDISIAGAMAGFEGDRSSLLRFAEKAIELHRPKYAIAENVKNLVSKKFKADFEALLVRLEALGYKNYWKVLNAAEFGVPQNRERVFLISIRKDLEQPFWFPTAPLTPCSLFDVLEDERDIPEKLYYPDDKARPLIEKFLKAGLEGLHGVVLDHGELREIDDTALCIDANYHKGFDNHGQRTGLIEILPLEKGTFSVVVDDDKLRDTHDRSLCIGANYRTSDHHGQRTGILTVGRVEGNDRPMHLRVFDPEGHSPTLLAHHDKQPKIMVVGELPEAGHIRRRVHNPEGASPAIRSHHTDSPKIVVVGELEIAGERDYARRVYDPEGIAPTVTTQFSKGPKITVLGRAEWINGHDLMKRIYSVDGISPTLNTAGGGGREPKIQLYARIRRLSPLECWRLMGQDDADFRTAKAQTSDSQLYKQAGNSIVVDVIEAILTNLLDRHPSVLSLREMAEQFVANEQVD